MKYALAIVALVFATSAMAQKTVIIKQCPKCPPGIGSPGICC